MALGGGEEVVPPGPGHLSSGPSLPDQMQFQGPEVKGWGWYMFLPASRACHSLGAQRREIPLPTEGMFYYLLTLRRAAHAGLPAG